MRLCACGCGDPIIPSRTYKTALWIRGHSNHRPAVTRFWERVSIDADGCWRWNGYRNACGYGTFKPDKRGGMVLAHRWIWAQAHGTIVEGLCVCHSCDEPSCVNPEHLWLGTPRDNALDRERKGRGLGVIALLAHARSFEFGRSAKLTRAQALEARRRHSQGEPVRTLAEAFHLSVPRMHKLIAGQSYVIRQGAA